MTKHYSTLIIGGGIFGVYAALYLAEQGARVLLVEKEKRLLQKASVVNQARLHSGYHYPRSVATAIMSDDNKARFTKDHEAFINFQFDKYYAIDKFGSFTDAGQFERFCEYINIKCEPLTKHDWISFNRIDALYATTEYTFDPVLMANYYRRRLEETPSIKVLKYTAVRQAEATGGHWRVELEDLATQQKQIIEAQQVLNATYAGSNAINRLFGVNDIQLMHEIAEMAFVTSPQVQNFGLTVMDGQYGSIMPYGLSGLLSLSSVAYTHHKVSYNNTPEFDCQPHNPDCKPHFLSDCNACPAKPRSNYPKMIAQMSQYFKPHIDFHYFYSLFTIKSKLRANYIDDGRPTEISRLHSNPNFYCIFAGKINSIYEIEAISQ